MRHHRQNLIPGWRQDKLTRAAIGVAGSGPYPASFFLASAAALGLRRFIVICPELDETFVSLARALDPGIDLVHIPGWVTHPATAALLDPCSILVDFSQLGLTNKILFNAASQSTTPLVTVRYLTTADRAGFRFFSYAPGRETDAIPTMIAPSSLTAVPWEDPATAMAAAGLALEEVKRILFDEPQTRNPLVYVRIRPSASLENLSVAIIGAGALANFAAPTLVLLGCRHIALFDPDRVDVTNLNRQIFFAQAVGAMKASALAHRLNTLFGADASGIPHAFDEKTGLSLFDAVLDCVDNFETRLILSRRAQDEGKILISGGTGPDRGQLVAYHPRLSRETPGQILNLEQLVRQRFPSRTGQETSPRPRPVQSESLEKLYSKEEDGSFEPSSSQPLTSSEAQSASCRLQADPSVVMSNQIIGALMADMLHRILSGEPPGVLFYESSETEGLRLTSSWDTDFQK